jgi:RNA polymerase primary sigma factor
MLQNVIGSNSPLDRIRRRRGLSGSDTPGRTARRTTRLSAYDEVLLKQVLAEPMDFIDGPEYHADRAEDAIYKNVPSIRKPDVAWYRPLMDDPLSSGARREPGRQSSTVLLTAEEERILFRQFNFARFRVSQLQKEIGAGSPTEDQAHEILRWYRIANAYREQIAETNLALVLAMAKRTRMSEVDFADLVSEGNMALLRSVDKFDCNRGFKFSTYACRAILKAFSRQGMKLSKYRQRFPTDFDPALEKSNHLENVREQHVQECADEVKYVFLNNDAALTPVERTVIHHRFGLGGAKPNDPLTLEQVGQIIGVTKERVRQIQNKALEKLRFHLEENALLPEDVVDEDPGVSPN